MQFALYSVSFSIKVNTYFILIRDEDSFDPIFFLQANRKKCEEIKKQASIHTHTHTQNDVAI